MIWYTWRQSRLALLCFVVISMGIAVALIIIGLRMYQDVHILQNPLCQQDVRCNVTTSDLSDNQTLFHIIGFGLIFLPVLLGIFIGVPLVAREYEQRTYQFILTQGITYRRWLAAQLAMLFGTVIVLTVLLSLLINWGVSTAFASTAAPTIASSERFSLWGFDLSGTVPVAYATFALALGLACGALLRRTLPAIAATLFGYLVVRLPLALFVRPHYLAPLSRTFDVRAGLPENSPAGPFAWILENGVQRNGLRYPQGLPIPTDCWNAAGATSNVGGGPGNLNIAALNQCLHDHGWSLYILYQPYSRFWPLQGIESAIFLALAVGLVAATFALVLRRPH